MGKYKRSKKGNNDEKIKDYNKLMRNHKNIENKHSELADKIIPPMVIPEDQLNKMINNYKKHQELYITEKTDNLSIE